ncbi:quorum-quenching N-acyl homoserine lactonase AiiA [Alicyclobacillus dauci]|uniref:quorum-quenching N-acyl-homoserine lactonase n=1 Tax=Alicyclobacillus dauci TaxID=1475485 RepID=A0ABY6Z399_9BACL|nr:N-acyl homoserine lactonase family protein [Alicyclobacillus dauci]WAH37093.1 N-acyl homoserine lactonase family protein [Alicyclobacillus dauci]
MAVKKLYFLPVGQCYLDQSAVNRNLTPGHLVEMPVWCFLLETRDGPILIDTGMPDSFVNNPDYYNGTQREGRVVPNMSVSDQIVNVMRRVGYHPEDIQAVISSHLHLDHAGGNGHFPNVPIIVQRAEFDAAMGNDNYSPQECRLSHLNYQIIEGDYELTPGVDIVFTPGHSPGHQSILVTTERSGPVLLTIDVAYTRQNFENGVPFLTFDPNMAAQSINRMQQLIEQLHPSTVFFGHDRQQAKEAVTFPDFL